MRCSPIDVRIDPILILGVRIDEIVSDPDSADLKKIEQDLIADIKSGKTEHPDGGFYSEEEYNMFITVVPTGRSLDKFCDDE